MRTAELAAETEGESWKSSSKNEQVELGNRFVRHAPGSPAPKVIPGPALDSRTERKAGKTKGKGRTTKQYYSQHPKNREAVSKEAAFLFSRSLKLPRHATNVIRGIDAGARSNLGNANGDSHPERQSAQLFQPFTDFEFRWLGCN